MNPNSAADANLDKDGDGISNKNEYFAGSNPSVNELDNHDIPFLPPWAMVLLAAGLLRVGLRHQRKLKRS